MIQTLSLVLFVVASVGCGKSKIEKKSDNVIPAATGEVTPQGGGRGQGRTVAPNQPGVSAPQVGAPAPAAPPKPIRGVRPGNGPGNGSQTGTQPGKAEPGKAQPETSQPDQMTEDFFDSIAASNVKFDETEALKTGGQKTSANKNAKTYFYTGASKDGVLENLVQTLQRGSEAEKSTNIAIAALIDHAQIGKTKDGLATLALSIEYPDKSKQSIRFKADAEATNTLTVSKSSPPVAENQLHALNAQIACLDAVERKSCSVQAVKVNFTNGSAYLVFRNTIAYAFASFVISDRDFKHDDNQAFKRLMAYFANRTQHVKTNQKVDDIMLSSFEVIGGKSELAVVITTEDKQMATFKVPLVSEAQGVSVSHPVSVNTNVSNGFNVADLTATHSRTLLAGIDSVRLVNNNGLGDIRLRLKFDKVNSAAKAVEQSHFDLTLARQDAEVDLQKLQQIQ